MSSPNLEDFLNEELLGQKPKKQTKKKKKQLEWNESDPKEILEQESDKQDKSDSDDQESDEELSDKEAEVQYKDDEEKDGVKIEPDKPSHTPDGERVMEISLALSGQDYGSIEIGSNEYSFVTDLNKILSYFNISGKKLQNPETTVESLSLTVKELKSQTKNTVQLNMGMDVDDNVGINVKVNEMSQIHKDIASAVNYFNIQYQNYIIKTIDSELE